MVIVRTQCIIRGASSVLYRATGNRAYFKDVRILVPESWSKITANASTWETYSVSIIDPTISMRYN